MSMVFTLLTLLMELMGVHSIQELRPPVGRMLVYIVLSILSLLCYTPYIYLITIIASYTNNNIFYPQQTDSLTSILTKSVICLRTMATLIYYQHV